MTSEAQMMPTMVAVAVAQGGEGEVGEEQEEDGAAEEAGAVVRILATAAATTTAGSCRPQGTHSALLFYFLRGLLCITDRVF